MRISGVLGAGLALMLAGCVAPVPVAAPQPGTTMRVAQGAPITIRNDKGGNVMQMVARRQQLAASGRPVQIRGVCSSACTMLLSLPNACLAPDASVGFHAPRLPGTQVIPPLVDQIMAQYYRAGILSRWNEDWKYRLEMTRISGREAARLDPQIRLCPPG
ncbi:hypothetical protein [Paracoccus jiaweipingae]|uniref:hypothetical protein n=1 Tax=unclassified Paracoccus (in: a-proteobacteria) TaxID=2688777 RepID=UPI0037AA9F47